jgi:hypothetical protein
MTFADFKKYALATIKRSAASLTVDSIDLLAVEINNARKMAEKMRKFQHNRVEAKVDINFEDGALVSAITDLSGAALNVRTILRAMYAYDSGGNMSPIDVVGRDWHLSSNQRLLDSGFRAKDLTSQTDLVVPGMVLVKFGEKIYLSPSNADSWGQTGQTSMTIYLDVIKWMDEYTADSDTDFFLTHHADFLLLKTLERINFSLKEDQRIPINQSLLKTSWAAVEAWDEELLESTIAPSVTLD